MYSISFTVPETHAEIVKEVIFKAGAGKIGNYSHSLWHVLGEGQFKPLEGSSPFIGEINKVEFVKEYKVETVCADEKIRDVYAALKSAHPYELPFIRIWKLEEF